MGVGVFVGGNIIPDQSCLNINQTGTKFTIKHTPGGSKRDLPAAVFFLVFMC